MRANLSHSALPWWHPLTVHVVQELLPKHIKKFSNRKAQKSVGLNCQSGTYQRVLMAKAFTQCIKLGLMQCQLCGVGSTQFATIASEHRNVHFDHWEQSREHEIKINPACGWCKISRWTTCGSLRPLLTELRRTRLLHGSCHSPWDEHDADAIKHKQTLNVTKSAA